MSKVLPYAESFETKVAFEAVKLYLYDLMGELFSDDEVLHFLCIDFLVNGTDCEYLPKAD